MTPNVCFRVSVDDVARDFAKYADLAKTRTFEIYDRGKVEVMLVRIAAVPEWHGRLQINVPTELLSDEERAEVFGSIASVDYDDPWPDDGL